MWRSSSRVESGRQRKFFSTTIFTHKKLIHHFKNYMILLQKKSPSPLSFSHSLAFIHFTGIDYIRRKWFHKILLYIVHNQRNRQNYRLSLWPFNQSVASHIYIYIDFTSKYFFFILNFSFSVFRLSVALSFLIPKTFKRIEWIVTKHNDLNSMDEIFSLVRLFSTLWNDVYSLHRYTNATHTERNLCLSLSLFLINISLLLLKTTQNTKYEQREQSLQIAFPSFFYIFSFCILNRCFSIWCKYLYSTVFLSLSISSTIFKAFFYVRFCFDFVIFVFFSSTEQKKNRLQFKT